jgi:hypothetical protein
MLATGGAEPNPDGDGMQGVFCRNPAFSRNTPARIPGNAQHSVAKSPHVVRKSPLQGEMERPQFAFPYDIGHIQTMAPKLRSYRL